MKYTLVGIDGRNYGPAAVETLRQWAQDNRLALHSTLIDDLGERLPAHAVEDLFPQIDARPWKAGFAVHK